MNPGLKKRSLAVVAIVASAAIFWAARHYLFAGVSPEELAAARLDRTPSELARDLGGTVSDPLRTSVKVPLSGLARPFVEGVFGWETARSDHPDRACLFGGSGSTLDPRIATAIAKRLHGGLDEKGEWRWNGSILETSGALVCIRVVHGYRGRPPDIWRKQLEAGWQVLLEVAYGIEPTLSSTALADLTGTGYAVESLTELQTRLRSTEGIAAAQEKYRGANTDRISDSTTVEIVIDHPLFRTARLRWSDGLGLSQLSFTAMPDFAAHRQSFIACMAKEMGASREYEGAVGRYVGLLADSKVAHFTIALGGSTSEPVELGTSNAMIDPALWARAIAAVGKCRG